MIKIICRSFIFDGISSEVMGIQGCHIVNIGGENDTMPIFGGQSIVTGESLNSESPIFIQAKKENLKFDLTFTLFNDAFTPEKNYYLGKIFAKSRPVKFEIYEDRQKMIYVTPISGIEIVRFIGKTGYFKITLQAETPYWLTPPDKIELLLQDNGKFFLMNKTNVQNRRGAYDVYPILRFKVLSMNGNQFKITHLSDNNREIIFNNLTAGETIEMDCRQIRTLDGQNRFKDWNKELFKLHGGTNNERNDFQVNSACEISMEHQFQIFQ